MYDLVAHVADLPANVIEDILSHLLVLEARPLSFSQIAEIKDLATRRVWRKVRIGDCNIGYLRIGEYCPVDSDCVAFGWDELAKKLELQWQPPHRIESVDAYVPVVDEDQAMFSDIVVGFLNTNVKELTMILDFDGDFNGDEENVEMLEASVLPRLPLYTSLRNLRLLHCQFRIPAIDGWSTFIRIPEGLRLFLCFDDYCGGSRVHEVTLPSSLTEVQFAFDDSGFSGRLPTFPANLKRVVWGGALYRWPFEEHIHETLEELWVWSTGVELMSLYPFPDVPYSEWPPVAVPADALLLLPPKLKHNLVAK